MESTNIGNGTGSNEPTPVPRKDHHQKVALEVDFTRSRLFGFVELSVVPAVADIKNIRVNCSGQCTISNVSVNGVQTTYALIDPLRPVIPDGKSVKDHAEFRNAYLDGLQESGAGELVVDIPESVMKVLMPDITIPVNQFYGKTNDSTGTTNDANKANASESDAIVVDAIDVTETTQEQQPQPSSLSVETQPTQQPTTSTNAESVVPSTSTAAPAAAQEIPTTTDACYDPITIRIEYAVESPKAGAYFVLRDDVAAPHRYPQFYTHNQASYARLWLPSMDVLDERCTWQLEVTVPSNLSCLPQHLIPSNTLTHPSNLDFIAVASGDLIQQCIHPITQKKTFFYAVNTAVCASSIMISVGCFEKVKLTTWDKLLGNTHHVTMANAMKMNRQNGNEMNGEFGDADLYAEEVIDEDEEEEEETEQQAESNNNNDAVSPVALTSPIVTMVKEEEETVMGGAYAFCLPGRREEMEYTIQFLSQALEFFIQFTGSSYPFSSYKLVFLDTVYNPMITGATMGVFGSHLLLSPEVIDQVFETRRILARALISQWFGHYIVSKSWVDTWLITGLIRYLTELFIRKTLGKNEFRFHLRKSMHRVTQLDVRQAPLCPISMSPSDLTLLQSPRLLIDPILLDQFTAEDEWSSPRAEFIGLKAPLVLYMLDRRLGKGVFQKIVNKLMVEAISGELPSGLSTQYFLKMTRKVSGGKIDVKMFADQWIYGSGVPVFVFTYHLNRKRMMVEFKLRQFSTNQGQEGCASRFMGPFTIRVHEPEGSFDTQFAIDSLEKRFDVMYHSRRRGRRKNVGGRPRKIREGGEEVPEQQQQQQQAPEDDAQDGNMDDDGTGDGADKFFQFEWIRLDPDVDWLCVLHFEQPDYQWCLQLERDRDVIAQYDAIRAMMTIPSQKNVDALYAALMDKTVYYGVRMEAAQALAKLSTPELDMSGMHHLLDWYHQEYCYEMESDRTLPKRNQFADLTSYFVQKTVPTALGKIRGEGGIPPAAIRKFLLTLLRYNDNTGNEYEDNYFVSSIITSLANSFIITSPSSQDLSQPRHSESLDNDERDRNVSVSRSGLLSYFGNEQDVELFLEAFEEIQRFRGKDRLIGSYHNTVTLSCLQAYLKWMLAGLLKKTLKPFLLQSRYGNFVEVRQFCIDAILLLGGFMNPSVMSYLLDLVHSDPCPSARFYVAKSLVNYVTALMPPDDYSGYVPAIVELREYLSANPELMNALWKVLNDDPIPEHRLQKSLLRLCELIYETDPQSARITFKLSTLIHMGGDEMVQAPPKEAPANASPVKIKIDTSKFVPLEPINPMFIRFGVAALMRLKKHPYSAPFLQPVEEREAPGYHDIISKPMDISTAERRLREGIYNNNVVEFLADVRLIFTNCQTFNPEWSLLHLWGKEMEKYLDEKIYPIYGRTPPKKKKKPIKTDTAIDTPTAATVEEKKEGEEDVIMVDKVEEVIVVEPLTVTDGATAMDVDVEVMPAAPVASLPEPAPASAIDIALAPIAASAPATTVTEPVAPTVDIAPALIAASAPATTVTEPVAPTVDIAPAPITPVPAATVTEPVAPTVDLTIAAPSEQPALIEIVTQEPPQQQESQVQQPAPEVAPEQPVVEPTLSTEPVSLPVVEPAAPTEPAPQSQQPTVEGEVQPVTETQPEDVKMDEQPKLDGEVAEAVKAEAEPQAEGQEAQQKEDEEEEEDEDVDDLDPKWLPEKIPPPTKSKLSPEHLKMCKTVLARMKSHKTSLWYKVPVDPIAMGISHYFSVITKPMDLSVMTRKIESGFYNTVPEFEADMDLIFQNSFKFNPPDSEPYKDALILENYYHRVWQELNAVQHAIAGPSAKFAGGNVFASNGTGTGVGDGTVAPGANAHIAPVGGHDDAGDVIDVQGGIFGLTYEEHKKCQRILKRFKGRKASEPFLRPVPPTVLGYYDRIKQPIDLGTMARKLEIGTYKTPAEFEADLRLIVTNCETFNGIDHLYSKMARELFEIYQQDWNATPETLAKADPLTKATEGGLTMEEAKRCQQSLKKLKIRPAAESFTKPVPTTFTSYHAVISHPVDLTSITKKFEEGQYKSVNEFEIDIRYMFTNCRKFNGPDAWISQQADDLEEVFDKDWLGFSTVVAHVRELQPDATPDPAAWNVSEEAAKCRLVLQKLLEVQGAEYFNPPVDPIALNVPDYFRIIKRPMDFQTVSKFLELKLYSSAANFVRDVKLIFQNCVQFNGATNWLTPIALKLDSEFDSILSTTVVTAADLPKVEEPVKELPKVVDHKQALLNIISDALKHERGVIFSAPVDRNLYPDYYEKIKEPMDLKTMTSKVNSDAYETFDQFEYDFNIMLRNAFTFNKSKSYGYECARSIQRLFNREWAEFLKSIGINKPKPVKSGSAAYAPPAAPAPAPPPPSLQSFLAPTAPAIPKPLTPPNWMLSIALTPTNYHYCDQILKSLMAHPNGNLFSEPVTEVIAPGYFSIITSPMDLGTARRNLVSRRYTTLGAFWRDVELVFENCFVYNGIDSPISGMAKELKRVFETAVENISWEGGNLVSSSEDSDEEDRRSMASLGTVSVKKKKRKKDKSEKKSKKRKRESYVSEMGGSSGPASSAPNTPAPAPVFKLKLKLGGGGGGGNNGNA